jgi:hypothetical protein
MSSCKRGVGVVKDVLWRGEGKGGVVDEFGHEDEEHVAHVMEEIFQEQGVLHVKVDTGANELHEVEQLQEVAGFGNNVEDNSNKKPGSHDQWQIAGNRVSGALLIIFIVVKVVDDLIIEVDTNRLVGLLGVEVWDC